MGGHAVKLIGWGTSEEGEDYWVGTFPFLNFKICCVEAHYVTSTSIYLLSHSYLQISGTEDGEM
jgi:hypothetical protein